MAFGYEGTSQIAITGTTSSLSPLKCDYKKLEIKPVFASLLLAHNSRISPSKLTNIPNSPSNVILEIDIEKFSL